VLFPVVKQPGYEANHTPLPTANVKGEHSYTSNPPYAFTAHTGTIYIYLEEGRTAKAVGVNCVKNF
jgi:hypothetical protein